MRLCSFCFLSLFKVDQILKIMVSNKNAFTLFLFLFDWFVSFRFIAISVTVSLS